jgi:hypothetical protein
MCSTTNRMPTGGVGHMTMFYLGWTLQKGLVIDQICKVTFAKLFPVCQFFMASCVILRNV